MISFEYIATEPICIKNYQFIACYSLLLLWKHNGFQKTFKINMYELESLIQSLVDIETEAWNKKDAETLVSLFHPDMIWPWPQNEFEHDPAKWVFPQGRYNKERWKENWNGLFRNYQLIHNIRKTIKIVISEQGDGAFAVVDVDTLWQNRSTNEKMHWKGRSCKGYTKIGNCWLLILHTGLLDYEQNQIAV